MLDKFLLEMGQEREKQASDRRARRDLDGRRPDPVEVSRIAKERAWQHVLERKGRDWLLTRVPPTLRRRLETRL